MADNTILNRNMLHHIDGENLPFELKLTLRSTEIYQGTVGFVKKWTGILGKILFLLIFSPFLIIGYFIAKSAYIKLDKLVAKYKLEFESEFDTLGFKEVKDEEEELLKISAVISPLATELKIDHKLGKPFSESVISINDNLNHLIQLCQSKFKYSADEFFSSDEELKAFNNAFAELGDVWNYETTKEEQEFVFNSKKKTTK